MKTFRHILAIPFAISGAILFKVAEFIGGGRLTYRLNEAIKTVVENTEPRCTVCGHVGKLKYDERYN